MKEVRMEGKDMVKAAAAVGAALVMGIGAIGPTLGKGLWEVRRARTFGNIPKALIKYRRP